MIWNKCVILSDWCYYDQLDGKTLQNGEKLNIKWPDSSITEETVYLIEPGLTRFSRVRVGRTCEDGKLIYSNQEMPLGPEEDVLDALLTGKESINHIPNVLPYRDWETDRKSTRLNSSHSAKSRMPSSA